MTTVQFSPEAAAKSPAVRAAHRRYAARRRELIRQGRWQFEVPAEPVREHIRQVMSETGMTLVQFAAAAEISFGTLQNFMYRPRQRVTTETAGKVTAVTTAAPVPGIGRIGTAGSTRRLQALAVLGWSCRQLGARLGIHENSVRRIMRAGRPRVTVETAAKIRRLYDDLWNTPAPQRTPSEREAARRIREAAERDGWLPGAAWNDDEIDSPAAVPVEGWKRGRERKIRPAADLIEDAEHLLGFGQSFEMVAARLGVTPDGLEKALARAARRGRGAASAETGEAA